jgi:hypothetical protein
MPEILDVLCSSSWRYYSWIWKWKNDSPKLNFEYGSYRYEHAE